MSGLTMAGLTDPGRQRAGNEDSIAVQPELGLAVLADGMGGHQAGEVASSMAVDIVRRHFVEALARPAPRGKKGRGAKEAVELRAAGEAIRLANSAIYEMARARPECAGMGSTIVVAVFYGDKMCVAHVGDSRLYRFRRGRIEQLTQDHSVIQELVSRGLVTREEAQHSIGKNLVTRALGVESGVTPDIAEQTVQNGDIYLLCSDGLNDVITDPEIAQELGKNGANLEETTRRLVALANARGGPDNISVILARTGAQLERGGNPPARPRAAAKQG